MRNKVIKYGKNTYKVEAKKIKSVDFEIFEDYTSISVCYTSKRYSDFVFNINNDNKKVNIELLSDVYISIMTLNKELLKEDRKK